MHTSDLVEFVNCCPPTDPVHLSLLLSTMKIGEALLRRKELQNNCSDIQKRIDKSFRTPSGYSFESPPEDPRKLIAQLEKETEDLYELTKKIYRANRIVVCGNEPLGDALVRQDILRRQKNAYKRFAEPVEDKTKHIKWQYEPSELQRKADQYGKELELLELEIQRATWTFDVVDEGDATKTADKKVDDKKGDDKKAADEGENKQE